MKNQIRQVISKPALQPVWTQLLKLCHAGMNCGGGQSVSDSGEIGALDLVLSKKDRSRPFVLFDVGANDGEYLQVAMSRIGPELCAFSFEPQIDSFNTLRSRFSGDPRLQMRNAALGSEVGQVKLFIGKGESTSSLHASATAPTGRSEMVQITTVDRVRAEEGVGIIDLLKIDTEGHEMDVLWGAKESLRDDRILAIQVEFGETFLATKYHFCDIYDLLSAKYKIYRILRRGLYELTRYTHDLEIYKLTNYLCIHR